MSTFNMPSPLLGRRNWLPLDVILVQGARLYHRNSGTSVILNKGNMPSTNIVFADDLAKHIETLTIHAIYNKNQDTWKFRIRSILSRLFGKIK